MVTLEDSNMKQLILVRHAKSSWDFPSLTDHERPLNKRGKRDAPRMAEYLIQQIEQADCIISSTAERAKQTARHFESVFESTLQDVQLTSELYHASVEEILLQAESINDDFNVVLMFGHNPAYTSVANLFSEDYIDNVPTCGIVGIDFNIKSWAELTADNGKLAFFYYPKML